MPRLSIFIPACLSAMLVAAVATPGLADDPSYRLWPKNNQFVPSEVQIPAGPRGSSSSATTTRSEFESTQFSSMIFTPRRAAIWSSDREVSEMLATAIIVFREVLEAPLVVGIVLAASRGVQTRGLWVSAGIGAGVLGAALVAAGAVATLGWHNIWMNRHGRELAATAALHGKAVLGGSRPLYALALVVGIAVLREGSEIVLFLYGVAVASGAGALGMVGGGILGLAGGIALGALIYFGLLAIPLRRLFTVTSWLILLLAAGMTSQGAAFLMQANLLPSLRNDLWDTSSILSVNSILGMLLHVLIGYSAQPAGIPVAFYLATLLIIGTLMRVIGGAPPSAPARPAAATSV